VPEAAGRAPAGGTTPFVPSAKTQDSSSWTEIYQFAHIVTIFWCIITIFWCLHWQMQPWCKYFSIFGAESLF
jgi:hypothetical protein